MGNAPGKDLEKQRAAFLANATSAKTGLMKAKDFQKLQKQIQLQYPSLGSIRESMLIADNRLPDCPVVYANDQFERMTLHPKEAIIGINCRFLQGPLTDKAVVKELRNAVDNSKGLDVEILNYRKDGIPFWNLFLMLPVFSSPKRKGKAQFFIAVQKDVSLIKGLGKQVSSWSAPEVCMWLERRMLTFAVATFLENRVEGQLLLELTDDVLLDIGIAVKSERQSILRARKHDFDSKGHYLFADGALPALESTNRDLTADLQFAEEVKAGDAINVDLWGEDTGVTGDRVAIKCLRKGCEPIVFLAAEPANISGLRQLLREHLGRSHALEFVDTDGDLFPLSTDDDLETVKVLAEDRTFTVVLTDPSPSARSSTARALDRVGVAIMHVDAFGVLSFLNERAKKYFGNAINVPVEEVLPALAKGAWKNTMSMTTEVTRSDKSKSMMTVEVQQKGVLCSVLTLYGGDEAPPVVEAPVKEKKKKAMPKEEKKESDDEAEQDADEAEQDADEAESEDDNGEEEEAREEASDGSESE